MTPEWKNNMYLPGIHHQDFRPSEEPWLFPPDSGGKDASIEYTIISTRIADSAIADEAPYTGLVIATVLVEVASPGRVSLIDTQVDVVDHRGCVFDKPSSELAGVGGWASWRVAKSLDPMAVTGTKTPPHWCADDRCCTAGEGGGA